MIDLLVFMTPIVVLGSIAMSMYWKGREDGIRETEKRWSAAVTRADAARERAENDDANGIYWWTRKHHT